MLAALHEAPVEQKAAMAVFALLCLFACAWLISKKGWRP